MIKTFEDFEVYRRAYTASLEVHRISLCFPEIEQFELARQLRRSSKSICANIAEGHGKAMSAAEFKRFLSIALGSCSEAKVHLRYCKDLGYLQDCDYSRLISEYNEIGKMLSVLIRVWK